MKKLLFICTLILLTACNSPDAVQGKKPVSENPFPDNTQNDIYEEPVKFTPEQISDLAALEGAMLSGIEAINKNIINFKFGSYYYVVGRSSKEGIREMKRRAAELDAKRWGAIFMKFLKTGEEELSLRGEYVNFLEALGEFEKDGIVYKIYRFKVR